MNRAYELLVQEAALALDLYMTNYPLSVVHASNARKLAQGLGLSVRENKEEKKA